MKTKNIFAALGAFTLSSLLLTSCIQKNYYNTTPTPDPTPTYQYTFDEEFNGLDLYGWGFTSASDSAYASITGGSYQYVNYGTRYSNLTTVGTTINTYNDFTVKTQVKSNNTMGLIFGASNSDDGYAFFIDKDGYYALYREGNSSTASTSVIPFTFTSYAVANGWNTLEIDQTNGRWTGYINGTQVFSISSRTLYGSKFGYKVLPGTVGYADYLQVNGY